MPKEVWSEAICKKLGKMFVRERAAIHLRLTGKTLQTPHFSESNMRYVAEPVRKTHKKSSSPLLLLPAEIRHKIFGLAVVKSAKSIFFDTAVAPPLARVCKQVRAECLPIFFRDNNFETLLSWQAAPNSCFTVLCSPPTLEVLKELGHHTPLLKHILFTFGGSFDPVNWEDLGLPAVDESDGLYQIVRETAKRPAFRMDCNAKTGKWTFRHVHPYCRICKDDIPSAYDPEQFPGCEEEGSIKSLGGLEAVRRHHNMLFSIMGNNVAENAASVDTSKGLAIPYLHQLARGFLPATAEILCQVNCYAETLAQEVEEFEYIRDQEANDSQGGPPVAPVLVRELIIGTNGVEPFQVGAPRNWAADDGEDSDDQQNNPGHHGSLNNDDWTDSDNGDDDDNAVHA